MKLTRAKKHVKRETVPLSGINQGECVCWEDIAIEDAVGNNKLWIKMEGEYPPSLCYKVANQINEYFLVNIATGEVIKRDGTHRVYPVRISILVEE